MASILRNLLRMISQTRFKQELELKSVAIPVEDLRKKIELFEHKKREILGADEEYDLLLSGEIKKLMKDTIEEDLNAFKADLTARVAAGIEQHYTRNRDLPSRELYEALERHAIARIKDGFDRWRAAEDDKIAAAFNALCARFTKKIDDAVDELFRFASGLFAIAFDAAGAGSIAEGEREFHYKFWSEPTSLQMLASSMLFALPKAIGGRLILSKTQENAHDSIDMQSGRIRYELATRLDESLREFKREILKKLKTTLESIETAVGKGTKMAQISEARAAERRASLLVDAQTLDTIKQRLAAALERISFPHQA